MLHIVGRSLSNTLLFHDHTEAASLWWRLVRLPGVRALALMPDHLHILHAGSVRAVRSALSGYTRWRNHRVGRRGPGVRLLPPEPAPTDRVKQQRLLRYVHLNPCRARLCADPLAWPWSTHRDAVGLAVGSPIVARPDGAWFHRYVSSDPAVHVSGTELPMGPRAPATPEAVLAAVSSLTRTPIEGMLQASAARSLYLAAAAALHAGSGRDIARCVGVHPSRVRRSRASASSLNAVSRVMGDPRFALLAEASLATRPAAAARGHDR